MEELQNYREGLRIISATAEEYEEKREVYREKEDEKKRVEAKIKQMQDKINELTSRTDSLDDIKKASLAMIEKTYSEEIAEAERKFKAVKDEVESSEKKDPEVKQSIEKDFSEKIDGAYEKVNNIVNEVDSNSQLVEDARKKCDDLEQQINNSLLEENQIKLCASHIATNFENVVNNAEFINDYKNPKGASPEEAKNKFSLLSPKKIEKIASKMNTGAYVSSPDESKGLPIMEILTMAATSLWLVIKALFYGIGFLYKPMKQLYKVTQKIIYAVIVTLIVCSLVLFISTRFGNGIVTVLFIALITAGAIFLGMTLFNVIKYSSKAFRVEQNLEYYTVGYFFTNAKDEIIFKIASGYYTELKTKNPTELERILQSTSGALNDQKEMATRELNICEERLEASRAKMSLAKEQFDKEKSELEQQCKGQVDLAIGKLSAEREAKREKAKNDFDNSVAASISKRENAINNAEKDAVKTLETRNQDIASAKREFETGRKRQQEVEIELDKICSEVDSVLKDNNNMAVRYKEFDIKAVDSRTVNDKIPESLVAGLSRQKRNNLKTDREEAVYKPIKLEHRNEPIIITCNAEDDESKVVAESYYTLIDSLIADMLSKTYIGAFRFVLADSQGNKSSIKRCMKACESGFDELQKAGCLEVYTSSSAQCFDNVIKEQEEQLSGKSVDEVNEANKNLDTMVRYIFLCIRIYSKKPNDFPLGDFRRRVDSSLNNGIIPIVIMSQSYFDEKKSELEGTVRELCGSHYYKLDASQVEEIKVVNL